MSFYPELEQACIEQGIAVIKQVGDTVVINDAHLKVFLNHERLGSDSYQGHNL